MILFGIFEINHVSNTFNGMKTKMDIIDGNGNFLIQFSLHFEGEC